jgi:archaellum component FlaC
MWSQKDLETSIQSLLIDLEDHLKFIESSKDSDLHGIKKQVGHIRYELNSVAKKIEMAMNIR